MAVVKWSGKLLRNVDAVMQKKVKIWEESVRDTSQGFKGFF